MTVNRCYGLWRDWVNIRFIMFTTENQPFNVIKLEKKLAGYVLFNNTRKEEERKKWFITTNSSKNLIC